MKLKSSHIIADQRFRAALLFSGLLMLPHCAPVLIGTPGALNTGGLSISVSINATTGGTYADDDTFARTINFTHNGTSVLCSHDGGTTYATCNSSSTLIFTVADYTGSKVLKIKSTKGSATTIYTITLPTDIAGLTFKPCTTVVTGVANNFAAIAPIATGNTICIGEGAVVTNSGAQTITIGGGVSNFTILGYGSGSTRGKIVTGAVGQSTIDSSGTNLILSNLQFESDSTGGVDAIYITAGSATLTGSKITNTGAGGPGAFVTASATMSTVSNTEVVVSPASGEMAYGFVTSGAAQVSVSSSSCTDSHDTFNLGNCVFSFNPTAATVINLTNLTVSNSSPDPAVFVTAGTLSVTSSTITTTSADGEVFRLSSGNGVLTFSLTSSTVTGPGVVVKISSAAGSAVNATIDQSTLSTRGDNANPGGARALRLDRTGAAALTLLLNRSTIKHVAAGTSSVAMELAAAGVSTINSTLDQNRFCNVGTGAPWFTGTDDGGGWGGTFVLANQINGGAIGTCP